MVAIARSVRFLEWVCVGFVALGLSLPLAYHLPAFAFYRDALTEYVGDAALAGGSPTLTWCLAMTGGSIAGKWLVHWAIVHFGLREGARWAWDATWAGLLAWFVLDSTMSLFYGAWANVAMINGLPLLLVAPLLFAMRSEMRAPTPPRPFAELRLPLRAALIASVMGMGSGFMIAMLGDGALFGVLRDALGDAHFGGDLPASGRRCSASSWGRSGARPSVSSCWCFCSFATARRSASAARSDGPSPPCSCGSRSTAPSA